jgi:imidazolonepropionase-like amidohydrolase
MLLEGQAGLVREGYLADLLVIAGEPQSNVRLLQSGANIKLVMKDGSVYRNLFSKTH